MPAVSKAQQRFMGMVHAAQKGDMENPSPEVSKAADSMSDKDAKDFASTSHKGLPDKKEEQIKQLKEKIRQLVREKMVDEMNVTGNVQGYNSPHAFGKPENEKKKGKKQADLTGYSVVSENRWLDLKNEESTAQAKIGRGISNINKQLKEMERFLNWYGKIKIESGVNNKSYWKINQIRPKNQTNIRIMKHSELKELIRQVVKEESDYQQLFKHMLDRTGKSIPDMSADEKVKFFQAVDKAAKAKNEGRLRGYNEAELSAAQKKIDVDGDGEIEGSDLAALRKKD